MDKVVDGGVVGKQWHLYTGHFPNHRGCGFPADQSQDNPEAGQSEWLRYEPKHERSKRNKTNKPNKYQRTWWALTIEPV